MTDLTNDTPAGNLLTADLEHGISNVLRTMYGAALSAGLLLSSLVLRELGGLLKKRNSEVDRRTNG